MSVFALCIDFLSSASAVMWRAFALAFFVCVCVRDVVVVVAVKTPVIMRVSRLNGLRCQTGETPKHSVLLKSMNHGDF